MTCIGNFELKLKSEVAGLIVGSGNEISLKLRNNRRLGMPRRIRLEDIASSTPFFKGIQFIQMGLCINYAKA